VVVFLFFFSWVVFLICVFCGWVGCFLCVVCGFWCFVGCMCLCLVMGRGFLLCVCWREGGVDSGFGGVVCGYFCWR